MDQPEWATAMTSKDLTQIPRTHGGRREPTSASCPLISACCHGMYVHMQAHRHIYTQHTHTINNNNTLTYILFPSVKRSPQRYPKPSTHTFIEHNILGSQYIILNVELSPFRYFRKLAYFLECVTLRINIFKLISQILYITVSSYIIAILFCLVIDVTLWKFSGTVSMIILLSSQMLYLLEIKTEDNKCGLSLFYV